MAVSLRFHRSLQKDFGDKNTIFQLKLEGTIEVIRTLIDTTNLRPQRQGTLQECPLADFNLA